ncbi:helix-turn-helix domain-containing protein [Ruminococcus sp. YRD2003]|uniref:helix-turn-helix domain-containing protein n=1 Tax=Ruminococcus sp. YRD2003 TaxID=1452313 RepID=UPI000942EADE
MKRPSDELKEIIVERCLSGESITALANEYSISRGSIYNWLKKYKTQKKLRVNTGELRKLLCAKDHRLFDPCIASKACQSPI